jgi:protein TonB
MKCRLCHLSGLTVSVLVHAAAASAWLLSKGGEDVVPEQPVPVQLAMFVEQPVPDLEHLLQPEPESEAEPLAEITTPPEAMVEPQPQSKPEQLSEITTVPEAVVQPKPEKQLEPETKITKSPEPAPTPPPVKVKPKPNPAPRLARSEPEPKPETPSKPTSLPKPSPKPRPMESTQPIKPPTMASAEFGNSALDVEMLAQQEHHYRLEIIKRIENNKFFPKRARKMRQTGDVVIEFTLMRDGSLSDAKVLESTAPPILEKAALKAIRVSALFPPFPEIITRDSWSFRTSLEYRLR